ncbi:probable calcium-binding protein CML44 [Salvia hispanica]|uniref:probable calcium-binding protein CML44 n=1 Tax=Salvia hispanica TaxID=49212 RepID=UPI0020098EAC|nr:probable calcium-binding protein CML44 [Salvia hispanica]
MSPMISADDLHRIFKNLDKENKGVVGIDELHGLLGRIGVHTTPEELERFVGRTTLDYFEFLFFYEAMVKASNPEHEHEHEHEKDLRKAFEVFDLNGDGYISSEELRSVLSRLGLLNEKADDCKCMIGVYDDNSDGVLDFHEFKNMMSVANSGNETRGVRNGADGDLID